MKVTIIKAVRQAPIPFDDDRAVTDFRAFNEKARVLIDRVQTHTALDEIEGILTALQNQLRNRRNLG